MIELMKELNEAYGTKDRYQMVSTPGGDPKFYCIQKNCGLRLEQDSPWLTESQMSIWIRGQIAAIKTMTRRAMKAKEGDLMQQLKASVNCGMQGRFKKARKGQLKVVPS